MIYDTIIIGGGPAGLSAAIYAARFNLKAIVLYKDFGGLIVNSHWIENYPGFKGINGYDLMKKFEEHVKQFKVKMENEEVVNIKKIKSNFEIMTKKSKYITKTLIFATGTDRAKLNVPGEKEFNGKGVHYCASCDATFYKNKIVGVVGGSDAAAKEALLLAEYAKEVYMIYRREHIRSEPITCEQVRKNKKIKVISNTNVLEIKGKDKVEYVVLDKAYNGSKEFKLDALFIEIGGIPGSQLASKLGVKLDNKGRIIVDKESKTNIQEIYAAGDVTNGVYNQVITSAAEGVIAIFSVYRLLKVGKV